MQPVKIVKRSSLLVALASLLALTAACSDDGGSPPDQGADLAQTDAALRDMPPPFDAATADAAPGLDLVAADSGAVDLGSGPDSGFVCSPPAKPGEIYKLSVSTGVRDISLCEYRGKVLLIVNIAAKCGYTPQLGTLAQLYKTYASQGLEVLGLYSNQFLQAGSEQEQQSCEASYGVTFQTFPNVAVNPPGEHPLFTWLKAQPGFTGDVKWNFEKFLVSRDGTLLKRWLTAVAPDAPEVVSAIQAALQASP